MAAAETFLTAIATSVVATSPSVPSLPAVAKLQAKTKSMVSAASASQLLHRHREKRRNVQGPSSLLVDSPPFRASLKGLSPIRPKNWIERGVRNKISAEVADARVKAQLEVSQHHKRAARKLFERPEGGGQRTRLGEAEDEVSLAIDQAPAPNPTLHEFRSLVRATRQDFEGALDDAHRAKELSETIRKAALLREARALSGLGRLNEAGSSYLQALDWSCVAGARPAPLWNTFCLADLHLLTQSLRGCAQAVG